MRRRQLRGLVRTARDRALASERVLWLARRETSDSRRSSRLAEFLPQIRKGLPPGLDVAVVEAALEQLGAGDIERSAYVALSGWKRDTWTSRVLVVDSDGRRHTIVAKVTDYDEHVPAFEGLPYEPGRPELAVLRTALAEPAGALASWMPRPLLAEPLDERRFVFAFVDVGRTHSARSGADHILQAISSLSPMQGALRTAGVPAEDLLDLQPENHAETLARYVHEHLAAASEPGAAELARSADDLVGRCFTPSWARVAVGPVHGDPNRSNVLFSRRAEGLLFIDWEWAGRGLPHADLACLTKVVPPEIEGEAVACFADSDPRFTLEEHRELHERAKLHRSLLDASFMAAQRAAKPGGVRFDLHSPIRRAQEAAEAIGSSGGHR